MLIQELNAARRTSSQVSRHKRGTVSMTGAVAVLLHEFVVACVGVGVSGKFVAICASG